MAKRILVYCVDNDPTSFYRGARPWQLLEKSLGDGYKIDYITTHELQAKSGDWDKAGFYDLVFLQRPYLPQIANLCATFKRMGCKVWVDEDDLQTDVPFDMHSAYMYMTEGVQSVIRGCLAMSDVVTVSTGYLGEEMKKLTKAEVITVPNAFDTATFPKPEPRSKEKVIFWRGAAPSHQANLESVRKDIYEVMEANPAWTMVFMGIQPWWYGELKKEFPKGNLPNIRYQPHTNTLFDYYEIIRQINPAIWIVPLVDNPFNRSRSNNAWADASWIGAKCIVPSFDEWKRPGAIGNFSTVLPDLGFKALLEGEIMDFENPHPVHEDYPQRGWNFIEKNLLLPDVNKQRLEIVKKLIG